MPVRTETHTMFTPDGKKIPLTIEFQEEDDDVGISAGYLFFFTFKDEEYDSEYCYATVEDAIQAAEDLLEFLWEKSE